MKAILRSINNFSCKLKQSNNLKYNISPKIRSNKFKSISGNGNVVLEDALNKNAKDYKIYGNTYQNTTSGKNLLDDKNMTAIIRCTVYNGVITTSALARASTVYVNINDIPLKAGEELYTTFKVRLKSGTASRLGYGGRLYDGTTYTTNTSVTPSTVSDEFAIYSAKQTVSTDIIANQMVFQAENATGVSDAVYEIKDIIVSTNPIDTYEEYTGGQPSPNSGYPQEIINCGNRTNNLFDFNNIVLAYYNSVSQLMKERMSVDYTNKNITLTSSTNDSYFPSIWAGVNKIDNINISVQPNTDYTLLYKFNRENIEKVLIYALNESTQKYVGIPSTNIDSGKTFNTGNYSQICIRFGTQNDKDNTCVISDIQLIQGISDTIEYEPYGYKIPVNVRSENLFDKDNANIYGGYINAAGVVTGDGLSSYDTIIYIECKPNTTYALKKMLQIDSANNRFRIGCTSEIPTRNMQTTNFFKYNDGATETQYVYTTSSNAKYLLFYCGSASNITTRKQLLNSIMVVEGSTIPDKYIPYYDETTNIYLDEPLRKIDEYSDYIDFINGKVIRNIKEAVFDGSENWQRVSSGNGYRFQISISNIIKTTPTNTKGKIFSSHFRAISATNTWNNVVGISYRNVNVGGFYIYNGIHDTLSDFKEWLSENNITVNYILETPTQEDIDLSSINLIEGKNIITIGTELESIIEVEYYSKEIIDISNYKYDLRKVED